MPLFKHSVHTDLANVEWGRTAAPNEKTLPELFNVMERAYKQLKQDEFEKGAKYLEEAMLMAQDLAEYGIPGEEEEDDVTESLPLPDDPVSPLDI